MGDHALRLGVNIDHVATVRQARGTPYPDLLEAATACASAGAGGITVHLREDRRHIQDADVYTLRKHINTALNLEMAVSPEIVEIALEVQPDEVCLVPEKREELTTEGGLDVAGQFEHVSETVSLLGERGIQVSLFIDPEPTQIEAAKCMRAPFVELHTGTYCDAKGEAAGAELDRLVVGAELAHSLGVTVNAGHGINLNNISGILEIPHLHALNIGHSIVADAILKGMQPAVCDMLNAMSAYEGGRA